jgi:hypothetical protein
VWDGFDLSGVQHADDLELLPDYAQVTVYGDGDSFFIASFNMASGGVYPAQTAALTINVAVGASFTVQYDILFRALPVDFEGFPTYPGTTAGDHVYMGAWNEDAFAAGFFVSQVGWAYTGEVTLDSSGNVVSTQQINYIPGSIDWIQQGKEYRIRIVLDSSTQLLSLYIQDVAAGTSLQLVALLVAIPTVTAIEDAAFLSVKGDALHTSWIELLNYQLSSKALYPSPPPVANAGPDQAQLLCAILQLDGSGSIDPGGYPLTYEWRLVDAPPTSIFCISGGDGQTLEETPPTGFTFSFYSQDLADADALEPVQINDVLTYSAGSFTIKGIVRSPTFYVTVEYEQLPENVSGIPFRVLRQTGISGPSTVNPTFYPDALGFYSFDLRVSDPLASSSPLGTDRSRVLINVLESPLPRGCSVDTSFLFNYLLSFWRQVEDSDRITTFWEALARVASTELLTLWQIEYAKSLRDIQRTFVRRWLHYDALLPEPTPDLTTLHFLWGGITSDAIAGGVSGVAGTFLVVSSPYLTNTVSLPLVSPGLVTPEVYAQELQARLREVIGPSVRGSVWRTRAGATSNSLSALLYPANVAGLTLGARIDGGPEQTATIGSPATFDEFVQELQAQLTSAVIFVNSDGSLRIGSSTVGGASEVYIDNYSSTLLSSLGGPITFDTNLAVSAAYVHVDANIPFTVMSSSSAPGFSYPQINSLIGASGGGDAVSSNTFRVSYSLSSAQIVEDDLLVVGRDAYRIARVVDDPRDPYPFQRIVVKDALPTTAAGGVDWVIPGWVESQFLNFYAGLVDRGDLVDFEVTVPVNGQNVLTIVSTTALGANPVLLGRLAINTAVLGGQLSLNPEMTVYLARVLRQRFIPIDSLIVDIPILTDVIEIVDVDAVLRRNVDYFIETFRGQNAIRFSVGAGADLGDVWEGDRPPPRLWAEYTYVDNSPLIEANFGAAIGVYRNMVPATVDYLSAVRGCWYAQYNGPTMADLRIALQVFLGLPFAEEAGTITEIRTNFLTQQSRILVQDADNTAIVRAYTYPRILNVETNPATGVAYAVGDAVAQFAPLVTGASIVDWVKDPKWFQGAINQGVFYEVQKYHTFLVEVDSRAFDLQALLLARALIQRIKPLYTSPLYVVDLSAGADDITVIDTTAFALTLHLYDTPCDRMGASYYFDEPWAAGSEDGRSWRNAFDRGDNPANPAPVYPGPPDLVEWGYDKEWLCPADTLEQDRDEVYAAGALPQYDSVFAYDTQITQQEVATPTVPSSYPATLTLFTSPYTGTITRLFVQLNGPTAGALVNQTTWQLVLFVNGTAVATISFTIGYIHPVLGYILTMPQNIELVTESLSVAVTTGDALAISIGPVSAITQQAGWTQTLASISFGEGPWAWDVPLAGGTYEGVGELE